MGPLSSAIGIAAYNNLGAERIFGLFFDSQLCMPCVESSLPIDTLFGPSLNGFEYGLFPRSRVRPNRRKRRGLYGSLAMKSSLLPRVIRTVGILLSGTLVFIAASLPLLLTFLPAPISAAEHCPCFSPAGLVQQCNTGPRTTVILFGPLDGAIPKGSNVPNFGILDRPMTVIPCRDITVSLLNSQFEGEPIPGCWQMLYDEDYGVFAFSFSAGRAGC